MSVVLNPQYVEIGKFYPMKFGVWREMRTYFFDFLFTKFANLIQSFFFLGKGFVTQYYALFDDVNQRNSLVTMYNVSSVQF